MDLGQSHQNQVHNSSFLDTSWIETLALEELSMEESGVINLESHLDPEIILEEESVRFMNALRECFDIYVGRFNTYRGNPKSGGHIKVFKISNTVNDFMLYRHSLKLVCSRKEADLITIGLMSNAGGTFAARVHAHDMDNVPYHEIRAHIGPFSDITWRFQGEVVKIQSIARHYLQEFIRHSAR